MLTNTNKNRIDMKEQALKVLLRYIDNTKEANDALSELLVLFDVSNSLDLRELEHKLDEALGKETRETLTEWIKQQRQ